MSSRALKKLQEKGKSNTPVDDDTESDDANPATNTKFNPFDLLDVDDCEEDQDEEQRGNEKLSDENLKASKPKPKKKKKKKKSKDSESVTHKREEDEIDASLREVNAMFGETPQTQAATPGSFQSDNNITMAMKALLTVEHKNLSADNEMRRIFGSRVVQAEANRRRNNQRRQVHHRSTWLVKPKDSWPPYTREGLSMDLLETKRGLHYFAFIHNKHYQEVQFKFLDAVESLQPQNIMNVLQVHPYHIDSLLQLSEVCKMSEDIQMATELVERALFAFENAFHSVFSLTQGNCRLDYRRVENRAFYLALFRHLVFVGQRGCYRTALEFCKLLLSMDPEGDPLCVLLMIDFYALRSEQYHFLIRMSHEWEAQRNLSQLPNFAFSVPLATYHHARQEDMCTEAASQLLQRSLIMFPGLLMPLLDQCAVQADSEVTKHTFFSTQAQLNQPEALGQLIALYVGRCFPCWKVPEVMTWLEQNVKEVLKRVDEKDPLIEEFANKRKSRYKGTPRNIYRHIIMSEIRSASSVLPPEIAHSPILSYDPLPPKDSIVSYERPQRLRRAQEESGALSLFFRSLLPNFNAEELVDEDALAGAVGGADGNNLQQGVGALMNAMRDLLQNIRPVEPPVENAHNDQGGDGEGNGADDAEWEMD